MINQATQLPLENEFIWKSSCQKKVSQERIQILEIKNILHKNSLLDEFWSEVVLQQRFLVLVHRTAQVIKEPEAFFHLLSMILIIWLGVFLWRTT